MMGRDKIKVLWAESTELRGLIQQTNAALAELRAEVEKLKTVVYK